MSDARSSASPSQIVSEGLRAFVQSDTFRRGGPGLTDPGRREKLVWPPHSVSHEYALGAADFHSEAIVAGYGETFKVAVAKTPYGFFGRCETLWNDAKGETLEEMLAALREGMEPMLKRRHAISQTLGLKWLIHQPIKYLGPLDLLKLLYCPDRDVAMESRTIIEIQASSGLFFPSLLDILSDRQHPLRRSPQWCVLDMFEDLNAFAKTEEESAEAVKRIKDLMWDAPDDYCRTIYKAGVVLGGHICTDPAADALLELLKAPSRIARRSASHAVFHLVEWRPELRSEVVSQLHIMAQQDPDELLRTFAHSMASDIEAESNDHVAEPVFPDEAA